MKNEIQLLTEKALGLLMELIAIPSFSSKEDRTAAAIGSWLHAFGIPVKKWHNNVFAVNRCFDPDKPTLLLNSHHDTVQPNSAYTRDPFYPQIEDGKLYGLGSNDAGGSLVSLLAAFTYFYNWEKLGYNLVLAATAEEETAGSKSLRGLLPHLPAIDVAIVGEPTLMNLAVAEKGLVVFDAEVKGTPSHAAHPNNDNAIYNCIPVLDWFRNYRFERISEVLGEVKLTVTQINGGSQHNVVPAQIDLVIDARVNDCYSNKEIAEILNREAPCGLKPRSLRLNSSSIAHSHPLVQAGIALGRESYGSPTLSDQAALSCQSLKMGPGDSRRSHSADEFIYVREIEEAIQLYIPMLSSFLCDPPNNNQNI